MPRLVHIADIHIGAKSSKLKGQNEQILKNAKKQAFLWAIELSNDTNADLFLIAGDLFDTPTPDLDDVLFVCEALKKCKALVFIVAGNHDHINSKSPYLAAGFSENVHIFKSSSVESVYIEKIDTTVYGASFTDDFLMPVFEGKVLDSSSINIVLAHGEVTNVPSKYNQISKKTLKELNADYVALGHVHKYSEIQSEYDVAYAYCGGLSPIGFDEIYEGGAIFGEVNKKSTNLSFKKLSDYAFFSQTIDIKGLSYDNLKEQIIKKYSDQKHILRLELIGENIDNINIEKLNDELLNAFMQLEIKDNTIAPRDVFKIDEENSLRGIFIKKMKERLTDENSELITLATKIAINAMEGKECI